MGNLSFPRYCQHPTRFGNSCPVSYMPSTTTKEMQIKPKPYRPLLSHLFRDKYPEPESSRGNTGHETGVDMNVGCWATLGLWCTVCLGAEGVQYRSCASMRPRNTVSPQHKRVLVLTTRPSAP